MTIEFVRFRGGDKRARIGRFVEVEIHENPSGYSWFINCDESELDYKTEQGAKKAAKKMLHKICKDLIDAGFGQNA